MRTLNFRLLLLFTVACVISAASCKPKKLVTQAPPVPVQPAPVQEAPRSAPAAESDADGDGIPDSRDNCPDKPGPADNGGCPVVAAATPSFNYRNILFEFNSAVLKTSSYPVLDEIAREMKKYPEMRFILNGHSSSEGSEGRNMTLSVDRAVAVKAYLVAAGISARNLETKGYGETMPLNSNRNEAERQQNRRVEVKKL